MLTNVKFYIFQLLICVTKRFYEKANLDGWLFLLMLSDNC